MGRMKLKSNTWSRKLDHDPVARAVDRLLSHSEHGIQCLRDSAGDGTFICSRCDDELPFLFATGNLCNEFLFRLREVGCSVEVLKEN